MLDVDYHGGDGTFKFDLPRFVSIHAARDYPYVNMGPCGYELDPHTSWSEYKDVLQAVLNDWQGQVDVVVLSLGFDTLEGDPDARDGYGHRLCPGDFESMARTLRTLGCKMLVVQEGGYKLEDLGAAATAFLAGCQA